MSRAEIAVAVAFGLSGLYCMVSGIMYWRVCRLLRQVKAEGRTHRVDYPTSILSVSATKVTPIGSRKRA